MLFGWGKLHKTDLKLLLNDFGPFCVSFGLHLDSAADSLELMAATVLQNKSVCFVPTCELQLRAMLSSFLKAYALAPCSTEAHFVVPTRHLVEIEGSWEPPWAAFDGMDADWLSRVKCISLSKELSVVYAPPLAVKHASVKLHFIGTGTPIAESLPLPSLNALHTSVQGFRYTGTVFGRHTSVFIDQGASYSFINHGTAKAMGLRIDPVPRVQVNLADNREVPIIGITMVNLNLQKYKGQVPLYVLNLQDAHEVILGLDWLHAHRATIDCEHFLIKIKHRNKAIVLREARPRVHDTASRDPHPFLTAIQLKRDLRKHPHARRFLCMVKPVTSDCPTNQNHDEFPEHRTRLEALRAKYSHVFVDGTPPGPPPARHTQHAIPLVPGARPPARPPYRLTPWERQELEEQVAQLLKAGYIRESSSPFASPVLFVPKPNGKWRMCIDYRALNKITVQNKYPLPRIDQLLDQLASAKVFSGMDLAAGYHQIRIAEEDVPKTAFTTHMGLFEYVCLPFGLSNAPSSFMAVMNSVFREYIGKWLLVYLDDLLIFSNTPDEHLLHIELVLQKLDEHKFYAQLPKCEFFKRELKFLGFVVGQGQLKTDPGKIKAILDYPRPKDVGAVRTFLGMTTYFRRFIEKYAGLTVPLTNLLKKDAVGAHMPWDAIHEQAFQELKLRLSAAPILALPDWNKPFEVMADASNFATGAVLLQDGHPVAYESRKLKGAETRYDTREREILALVHAIHAWDPYLRHSEFILWSDHAPLEHLQTQPKLSGRQLRWVELLQQYSHVVRHIPGERNPADALSRILLNALTRSQTGSQGGGAFPTHANSVPVATVPATAPPDESTAPGQSTVPPTQKPDRFSVKVPVCGMSSKEFRSLLLAAYDQDEYVKAHASTILAHRNGCWYTQKNELYIPTGTIRDQIMTELHDAPFGAHFGRDKVLQALKSRGLYWPGMKDTIDAYIKGCDSCQRHKSSNAPPAGLGVPLELPSARWKDLSMDFIGELPLTSSQNNCLIVICDRLTKMVHLIPTLTTASAKQVAFLFFNSVVRPYGLPDSIVCDRDRIFTSQFWKGIWDMCGTKLKMSTSYHPQTDGHTERVNRTLEEVLRHYVNGRQDDWDSFLGQVEFALNSAWHSSIKCSPFYAMYGWQPRAPVDVAIRDIECNVPAAVNFVQHMDSILVQIKTQFRAAQERQQQYYNDGRQAVEFDIGDKVLLSTKNIHIKSSRGPGHKKLLPKFLGPFPVVQKVGPVAYKLQLPAALKIHPVFHVGLLKLYKVAGRMKPPPVSQLEAEDDELFEVEKVLDHRQAGRKLEYLVKWAFYGEEHNSWELESEIQSSAPLALEDYWHMLGMRETLRVSRAAKRD